MSVGACHGQLEGDINSIFCWSLGTLPSVPMSLPAAPLGLRIPPAYEQSFTQLPSIYFLIPFLFKIMILGNATTKFTFFPFPSINCINSPMSIAFQICIHSLVSCFFPLHRFTVNISMPYIISIISPFDGFVIVHQVAI